MCSIGRRPRPLILAAPPGAHKRASDFVNFGPYGIAIIFEPAAFLGRRPYGEECRGRPISVSVRTFSKTRPVRAVRARSRFGYDHRWWGEAVRFEDRSYWTQTR